MKIWLFAIGTVLSSFMIMSLASRSHCGPIYKWLDKDGTVHFSQMPPPESVMSADDVEVKRYIDHENPPKQSRTISEKSFDIPLTRTASGYMVDVSINEKVKARMVLDTGAGIVILSDRIRQKLNVKPISSSSAITLSTAAGSIKAVPIILTKVQLGSAIRENVQAAVTPEKYNNHSFDGLLGLSFLEGFIWSIDYDKNIITLKPRQ
ncbi:MAG: TIGR02281 family clan AA aspartic protease [Deltaproteobacteria bacterium]|nr:TIGR02281 family clan AA aspartic protease [Deltaproteobacteria bacterium]